MFEAVDSTGVKRECNFQAIFQLYIFLQSNKSEIIIWLEHAQLYKNEHTEMKCGIVETTKFVTQKLPPRL